MAAVPDLARGRRSFREAAWRDAYEALTAAHEETPLGASDLELLGRAAYMLGHDDDYVTALEGAYRAYLEVGEHLPAVRCAFWIGHSWLFRGQLGPASGWFARAQRWMDREQGDVVERGYVKISEMLEHLVKGDAQGSLAVATEVLDIGERFGDRDLVAIGMMEQGHALVRLGRSAEGTRLIDETMVSVTSGETSPIVAGIVYCNTIAFCRSVYELRRVREWTTALTRWCARQPDMVAHTGVCLVHRAEIMTFGGAWDDALVELRLLGDELRRGALNQRAGGDAAYLEGEVHRLRGELELAEASYRTASALGREPQPGLAKVRLAQGRSDSAAATIRRAVAEASRGLPRVSLLPAYVEIMLAVGDIDAAAGGCRELAEIAGRQASEAIDAMSWQARGALALAEGDLTTSLVELRRALTAWQQLEAPYDAARCRWLIGRACSLVGDDDTAALELEAATEVFAGLGAQTDLAEVAALLPPRAAPRVHGLSPRECEVLRLVATGKSNREIAAALVLSEHTVARHLQNIFAKVGVQSRTAAGAFAYEHHLV